MKMKRIGVMALCVALLAGLMTVPVFGLESGVYTASVTTSYYNPDTGEVDDGGSANAALGEGMCRSATGTKALVEVDGDDIWITIRLLLASNCKDVKLYTRSGYNSYSQVTYTKIAEDSGNDSIDYRFKVSSAGVKLKGTMYVTPMGRDVLWYLYLDTSTLTEGSSDFVVSIDPTPKEETAPAAETASAPAAVGTSAGADNTANTAGTSAGASQTNAAGGGESSSPGTADTKVADANNASGTAAATDGAASEENKPDGKDDGDAKIAEEEDTLNPEGDGESESDPKESAEEEDGEVSDREEALVDDAEEDEEDSEPPASGGLSGGVVAALVIVLIAVAGGVYIMMRRKK